MWTHLDANKTAIEDICKPVFEKAREFERAWSIAELKLSSNDVRWLLTWFRSLTPGSADTWLKAIVLTALEDDACLIFRQMLGTLIICAGAEVCRDESREDSVWPAIRNILPETHVLRNTLFLPSGQPTNLTKQILTDACRALNLRHAMDLEGTQQWFETIKLQYGFTLQGAKQRLAEWLVNLGRPHAVQYLYGESEFSDLASESFKTLWNALRQYRRGLIGTEVRETIKHNPWIKPYWIDELLKEARAKISVLGTGEWHANAAEAIESDLDQAFSPVDAISLEWPTGKTPRIRLGLDRQALDSELSATQMNELDFFIDSHKLCRWIRQKDGSWSGPDNIFAEPEKLKQSPNFNPLNLAIKSISGEALIDWDFSESGLSDEVIVFDLDKKRMIRAGEKRLEPNGTYAILCDRKFQLQGCSPAETFEHNSIARKAIRLPSPLNTNLRISFDEFVLWQPVKNQDEDHVSFSINLETPENRVFFLNDRTKLILEGLPANAKDAELFINFKRYELVQEGSLKNSSWITKNDITLTPELAAGTRKVRVRFIFEGKFYAKVPSLRLNLFGAAVLRQKQENETATTAFEVLKPGDYLNRSEGITHIRIWTPHNEKSAIVFEADSIVGKIRNKKMRVRDIPGHGGELVSICHGERRGLGVICQDTGCVRDFHPAMLGCDAQIFFHSDKDPKEAGDYGYALYLLNISENQKARLSRVENSNILPSSNERIWKCRDIGVPLAIALTWKGTWLGAWWSCDGIRDYILKRHELSEQEFSLLRWFRVPVLQPQISQAFSQKVVTSPHKFIKTWLYHENLPEQIKSHDNILGLDAVVRHFLWNEFPADKAYESINIVVQGNRNWKDMKYCIINLTKLLDISPILFWRGMNDCLKRHNFDLIDFLQAFVRAQVNLPPTASKKMVQLRLTNLGLRTLRVTGMTYESLEEITTSQIKSLVPDSRGRFEEIKIDLLKIGQTFSGRKFLSAKFGLYLLALSK